jgi:hypothetical protein
MNEWKQWEQGRDVANAEIMEEMPQQQYHASK